MGEEEENAANQAMFAEIAESSVAPCSAMGDGSVVCKPGIALGELRSDDFLAWF